MVQKLVAAFRFFIVSVHSLPSSQVFRRGMGIRKVCQLSLHSDQCCQEVYARSLFDIYFIPVSRLSSLKPADISSTATVLDWSHIRPIQSHVSDCRVKFGWDHKKVGATDSAYLCELICEDYRPEFYVENTPWPAEVRFLADGRVNAMLLHKINKRRSVQMFMLCPVNYIAIKGIAEDLLKPGQIRTIGYCYHETAQDIPSPESVYSLTSILPLYEKVPKRLIELYELQVARPGLLDSAASGSQVCTDHVAMLLPAEVDIEISSSLLWSDSDADKAGIDFDSDIDTLNLE